MKLLTIITALVLSFSGYSRIAEEAYPNMMLEKSTKDEKLKKTESKFVFVFRNLSDNDKSRTVLYSIDGKTENSPLIENRKLEVLTTPGKHKFQFYYNDHYFEVYSDSLLIKPQYVDEYSVYFESAEYPVMTEKPVIYLYPETEIEVQVDLSVKGLLEFTYPEYNDGWSFIATPQGDLKFGDDTYNYLFWESTEQIRQSRVPNNEGFIVKGTEATTFLREKLTEAGLTSKEQSDFITYWGPRLQQNEYNFVRFEFNEACNRFAELGISPEPAEVYRIYILWHEADENYSVSEQKIISAKRDGFTVIEWGGQELPAPVKIKKGITTTTTK